MGIQRGARFSAGSADALSATLGAGNRLRARGMSGRADTPLSLVGNLELLPVGAGATLPVDRSECAHAAKGGHLAVCKWAREQSCPWGWHRRARRR